MTYSAVIIDESGADQGPVDVSGARNEEQVRNLAKKTGMKWLADNGAERAIVQVSNDGHGLSIEVRD